MLIRLENSEGLEPPGLREDAQDDLERLAEVLRADGHEVVVAGLDESINARLQESLEQVAVDVVNVVVEHGADLVVLGESIRRWAKRRRRLRDRDGAKATAVIWGPDCEVLSTVELPPPENDSGGQA